QHGQRAARSRGDDTHAASSATGSRAGGLRAALSLDRGPAAALAWQRPARPAPRRRNRIVLRAAAARTMAGQSGTWPGVDDRAKARRFRGPSATLRRRAAIALSQGTAWAGALAGERRPGHPRVASLSAAGRAVSQRAGLRAGRRRGGPAGVRS